MDQLSQFKVYLLDSFNLFLHNVGAYLPNLLSAFAFLLAGFVLAWMVKWIILRLGVGLDRIVQAIGFGSLHTRLKWPIANILGWLVYWVIILLFVRAALASLQLPSLAELLDRLLTYLPNLFVAVFFIIAGTVLGNSLRDKIAESAHTAGFRQAEVLGGMVRVAVIALSVLVGLSQIGLDVRLFELILIIFMASLSGSIALAFGLGAGSTVSNIISARYVKKNYRVGQRIRVQDMQGNILEMLPTGIVLETKSGRTFVPAKIFDEEASILLDNESIDES